MERECPVVIIMSVFYTLETLGNGAKNRQQSDYTQFLDSKGVKKELEKVRKYILTAWKPTLMLRHWRYLIKSLLELPTFYSTWLYLYLDLHSKVHYQSVTNIHNKLDKNVKRSNKTIAIDGLPGLDKLCVQWRPCTQHACKEIFTCMKLHAHKSNKTPIGSALMSFKVLSFFVSKGK